MTADTHPMITTRTPLRITLGGGGSDLTKGQGICLNATIDQYVTLTVADAWDDVYLLHYAEMERRPHVDQIEHRIFRDAFKLLGVSPGVQVASVATVPAGTGLGNSGAFTIGLLKALRPKWAPTRLADVGTMIDIGQQDQWAATYGGCNIFDFMSETITPIAVPPDSFALYYTGFRHNAAEILTGSPKSYDDALHEVTEMCEALESGPVVIGRELSAQWQRKLEHSPTRAHQTINQQIRHGLQNGAYGGKLVGAGDGGFILFTTDDEYHLTRAMTNIGCRHISCQITFEGSRCV